MTLSSVGAYSCGEAPVVKTRTTVGSVCPDLALAVQDGTSMRADMATASA